MKNPIGTLIEVKAVMQKTYFYPPSCPHLATVLWLPTSVPPFTALISGFVKKYEGYIQTYLSAPAEWTPSHALSLIAVRRSPFAAEIITAYTPKTLYPYLELASKEPQ
jgi:hypothetical protein